MGNQSKRRAAKRAGLTSKVATMAAGIDKGGLPILAAFFTLTPAGEIVLSWRGWDFPIRAFDTCLGLLKDEFEKDAERVTRAGIGQLKVGTTPAEIVAQEAAAARAAEERIGPPVTALPETPPDKEPVSNTTPKTSSNV